MRIAILSDLHLEFDRAILARGDGRKSSRARRELEADGHPAIGPNLSALRDACDVVVLAGDIDLGTAAIAYASAVRRWLGVPVVSVAGNHEFYHAAHQQTLEALRDEARATGGVHFLENDCVELVAGSRRVRFLGCTLWTDFLLFGADRRAEAMSRAAQEMTDFDGTITLDGERRFTPEDALARHESSRTWLSGENAGVHGSETVVVTHHAPSFRSVPQHHRRDLLSAAYASRLESLTEGEGPALWIHGHIHNSANYVEGRTRVVCNPRGYRPFELNKKFDAGLVVTV